MPLVGAQSRGDLVQGELVNCRVNYDGQVELASDNLLSNPDLMDFDSEGNCMGISLDAPEVPSMWAVYIRKTGDPKNRMTLQAPWLPMSQDYYVQQGPLVDGESPQDATERRARIAPPIPPYVEAVDYALHGYKGGWYGISYGWIVGGDWGHSPYITPPAPVVPVQLQDGQAIEVIFGDITPPKGVTGMYLAMTPRQSTQNATVLASTPLYIQQRINVQNGMRVSFDFRGPFRRGKLVPRDSNPTYLGDGERWDAPRWHFGRSDIRIHGFKAMLSWRFKTPFGWSKPQKATGVINTHPIAGRRCALVFRPQNAPPDAISWQPLYTNMDRPTPKWRALEERSMDEDAKLHFTDPDHWKERGWKPPVDFDRDNALKNTKDTTGVNAPQTPFDSPVVYGRATLDAGTYAVRCAYYDSDGRITAPSDPTTITIAQGQTIKVYKPTFGNLIPNANAQQTRQDDDNVPDGWQLVPTTNLTITTSKNKVVISDRSSSTADEDVALSPWAKFPQAVIDGGRIAIRATANFTRYSSGGLACQVRFMSADGSQYSTVNVEQYYPSGTGRHEFRAYAAFAASDANADITIPAWARQARLVFRALGSTTARNYDVEVSSAAFFAGMGVPRRYTRGVGPRLSNANIQAHLEGDEDEYSDGGSCYLVHYDDAGELTSALSGISLNAIEYFGPYGTLTGNTWPLTGYETPVRPNTTYTLSCYAEWFGITNPADMVVTAVRDRSGKILQVNDPLIPNAQGKQQTPRRFTLTFTTPPGASYLEIYKGGASDGYVRLYAFQLVEGTAAKPYTSKNALGLAGKNVLPYLDSIPDPTAAAKMTGGETLSSDDANPWGDFGSSLKVTTPGAASYEGITGLAPPAAKRQAGQAYTFSCYVKGSGTVIARLYDGTGTTNSAPLTLSPNTWQRISVTRTLSTSAAACDGGVVVNGMAQATFWVAGCQMEQATSPTDFELGSGDITTDGKGQAYVTTTLDSASPATVRSGFSEYMGGVIKWFDGGAVYTDDEKTYVRVLMRSSPDLITWSPWYEDFSAVPKARYWQIRAYLMSADPYQSPLVDFLGLYVARPYTTLLRPDGTEYSGGVIVTSLPSVGESRMLEELTPDDNSDAFRVRGRWRKDYGAFHIQCFTDDAARQIVRDSYDPNDDGATHIIESWSMGIRNRIRLTPPAFGANRAAHDPSDRNSLYVFDADVDGARIVEEGDFSDIAEVVSDGA